MAKSKAKAPAAKPKASTPAKAKPRRPGATAVARVKAVVRKAVGRVADEGKGFPALAARAARRISADVRLADPTLFAPLTEGERADAIRGLLEDERLRGLAKVGRYRVITVEPLVVKPPEPLAGRRLARVVVYDYASDKCVDACVDLDRGAVCHVSTSSAQPMLSREEEAEAVAIADADPRVNEARPPGAVASATLHYWSLRQVDFAYRRRSAAVLYGLPGARPKLVAVVSLVDREVVTIVPAEKW
jgi:hypothetical protein